MSTENMTHADIARELVRLGVKIPEGIDVSRDAVYSNDYYEGGTRISDEASAAMLVGVMTLSFGDVKLQRIDKYGCWCIDEVWDEQQFYDHECNSPLLSCFAAWKAARGAT